MKSEQKQAQARTWLLKYLQPGMTVYTVLRHTARSGMSRTVSLFITTDDGPVCLDVAACELLEGYDARNGGCKISGCGMDAGFHAVYNIAAQLWPEGFECIGDRCPSNDHTNGDRDYSPHHHKNGGYALRQQWM